MALIALQKARAAHGSYGVIFDRDEAVSTSRHVGYAPESGSKIRVLALTRWILWVDGVARHVNRAPKPKPRIMRYELTDYEWAAIKPFLPNKPAACRV
jgi:hypothetical protein